MPDDSRSLDGVSRRHFAAGVGLAAATANRLPAASKQGFGIDVFGLRSQGFSAFEHLDFCHGLGARLVHFSEPRFLGSLEHGHLRKVREHADKLELQLEIGFGSICPTSSRFSKDEGTAEEQLLRMFEAAHILGAKHVRCYLGSADDRRGEVPFATHMANTVRVLRNVRKKALKMGMKVAVENHAGDMQGWQLRELVEAAGPEHVGALYDSGNATWTLEDPLDTLEAVAPYVITSGIRDSAVWETDEGAQVQWCFMGDGNVGIDRIHKRYRELCPGKPFVLEIINLRTPREFAYRRPEFWEPYQDIPAHRFARFQELARAGKPYMKTPKPPPGAEPGSPTFQQFAKQQERRDVGQAAEYCKTTLGLG